MAADLWDNFKCHFSFIVKKIIKINNAWWLSVESTGGHVHGGFAPL